MKRKTTVYIAGKINGDLKYREKFAEAQRELESAGFIVLNPAILPDGFTYGAYMRICMAMLNECDTVCFLPDWEESDGAKAEYAFVSATKKDFFFLEDRREKL